jgi:hypothetical protein
MNLLSIGCNRKLAKGIPVFNLPQKVTCPGMTAVCQKICYAGKAERMYKAAAAMRKRNYDASLQEDFVDKLIAELQQLLKRKGFAGYMRFFESGDVYNQTMLDKIFAVCAAVPTVRFLMYTKSFHLNFLDKPSNLKVYWSTDSSTHVSVPKGPTAHIVLKGEPIPKTATCVHTSDKHYCGAECTICWEGKESVHFPQH